MFLDISAVFNWAGRKFVTLWDGIQDSVSPKCTKNTASLVELKHPRSTHLISCGLCRKPRTMTDSLYRLKTAVSDLRRWILSLTEEAEKYTNGLSKCPEW